MEAASARTDSKESMESVKTLMSAPFHLLAIIWLNVRIFVDLSPVTALKDMLEMEGPVFNI